MQRTDKSPSIGAEVDEFLGEIVGRLTEQLELGESIDLAAYKKECPDHFEQIEQLLPTLRTMVRLGRTSIEASSHTGRVKLELETQEKRLGDYRIMEEIGRGGMGVVYRAQQISMGRTVALKVLPFAAVMDEKAITRFKNEARAAGTLHHDNIVPVHAVGSERGVYYYAMALIEGLSLAQVIQAQKQQVLSEAPVAEHLLAHHLVAEHNVAVRQDRPVEQDATADSHVHAHVSPADTSKEMSRLVQAAISTRRSLFGSRFYREAVRIGIQASDALHHAHEHGIVHRDVKPGNLMIDRSGKTWVTDFGLARVESDASMTMTGDVLGTLRYMAPEQALASRTLVDQRADIYSLGATLYELLTLRPVFDGSNREELFKQLTFEDPKPLTRFQPGVPADLETIVLKAISKNPDQRYSTAAELADDLRAFQESRPIKAKRISIRQRSQKWAMRNQTLVVASAIVLLVAVVALTGSTIAISFQQSQTQAALTEVQQQRKRAEENFSRARDAVDTYLTRVSEDQILNEPGLQPLRRDLLELALNYYERFVEQHGDDPLLRAEYADAIDRVAEIRSILGTENQLVSELHSKALAIRRRLFEEDPQNDEFRNALAKSCRHEKHGENDSERLKRLEAAVELARPLTAPKHRLTLADTLRELALRLVRDFENEGGVEKMENAHSHLSEAIEVYEEIASQSVVDGPFLSLPMAYQDMATWHFHVGNREESKRYDLHAIEELERLEAAYPRNAKVQTALAKSYVIMGDLDRALAIKEKLAGQNPLVTSYKVDLAGSLRSLSSYRQREGGRENEAIDLSTKSLSIFQRLVEAYPERKWFRNNLGVAHKHLAQAQIAAGNLDEAIESCKAAIGILTKTSDLKGELGDAYWYLGQAHKSAKQWDEAIDAVKSCIEATGELSDRQLHFQTARSNQLHELAVLLIKIGRIEEAIVEYQRACSILEDNLSADKIDGTPPQIVKARVAYAHHCSELAIHLHVLNRDDEAGIALEKAIISIEPLFDDEVTARFAVMTSSDLLGAVARDSSNPTLISKLRQLLRENLDAELTRTRPEDGTDESWGKWNELALLGYAGLSWEGAEHEAQQAIKFAPKDPDRLLGMAPLLLLAGESEEYRQLCRRLLDISENESAEHQNHTVRLCGLDPNGADAADRVLALAKNSMTPPNAEHSWFIYGLGRAYYRAGQYENAVETLERALTPKVAFAEQLICFDLALAYHYWGRNDEAEKWYERAEQRLIEDGLQDNIGYHELAETVVLRHEAARVLGRATSAVP